MDMLAAMIRALPIIAQPETSLAAGIVPSFVFPAGLDYSNSFSVGQRINIQWQGADNFTRLSLGLRQYSTGDISWLIGDPASQLNSDFSGSNYPWNIALENGLSISESIDGNAFSFWLVNEGYETQLASSHFNITTAAGTAPPTGSTTAASTLSSTTTSSSTKTISTTLATSTSKLGTPIIFTPLSTRTVTSTSSTTQSTQTQAPHATAQLSKGAIAGLGVGIPVGIILLSILAWFLFRYLTRRKREAAAITTQFEMLGAAGRGEGSGYEHKGSNVNGLGLDGGKSELAANDTSNEKVNDHGYDGTNEGFKGNFDSLDGRGGSAFEPGAVGHRVELPAT